MCAAGIATVDYVLENRLWENVQNMGARLMEGLPARPPEG